ncbi:MAG TPA: Vps62-related protein [Solirubrobacteraceae bacterium]
MPAAALLAAAALAFGADPTAPVLVHDAAERSPATSVAAAGRGGPAGPVAYRRVSGAWRQYWLFYADNPQDRGIVRTGRHEGDWELVQYRVGGRGRPLEAVYAQHSGAERCGAAAIELRGGHPVVHVANGSHASYFRAGLRDRTWPDPNDESDGRGAILRPAVQPVTATDPAWMRFAGRWGASRAGVVPGEQSSPRGPAHQPQRWDDPAAFARSARPCRAGCDAKGECDGRETALAGAGAGGLLLLAGGLVARRRRRRRAAR